MTEGRSQKTMSPSVFPSVRHSVQQIGAAGLEPATSCSRSRRATGLRYAPMNKYHNNLTLLGRLVKRQGVQLNVQLTPFSSHYPPLSCN